MIIDGYTHISLAANLPNMEIACLYSLLAVQMDEKATYHFAIQAVIEFEWGFVQWSQKCCFLLFNLLLGIFSNNSHFLHPVSLPHINSVSLSIKIQ